MCAQNRKYTRVPNVLSKRVWASIDYRIYPAQEIEDVDVDAGYVCRTASDSPRHKPGDEELVADSADEGRAAVARAGVFPELTPCADEAAGVEDEWAPESRCHQGCLTGSRRKYWHVDLLLDDLVIAEREIVLAPAADETPLAGVGSVWKASGRDGRELTQRNRGS